MSNRKRNARGFTLLECLIAMGVLVVGGLGTLQLLDMLSRTSANVAAESEALSIARQLRSEMEQEQLLPADLADAHWAPGLHTSPTGGPIVTVGLVDAGAQSGRYTAQYLVAPWADPSGTVRALDITIIVDNQAQRVELTERSQRLLRPAVLTLRKEIQNSVAVITGGTLRW